MLLYSLCCKGRHLMETPSSEPGVLVHLQYVGECWWLHENYTMRCPKTQSCFRMMVKKKEKICLVFGCVGYIDWCRRNREMTPVKRTVQASFQTRARGEKEKSGKGEKWIRRKHKGTHLGASEQEEGQVEESGKAWKTQRGKRNQNAKRCLKEMDRQTNNGDGKG